MAQLIFPVNTEAPNSDNLDGLDSTYFAPASHIGAGGNVHAQVTTITDGFMTAIDKAKLDNITSNATKTEASLTNGNLKINDIEVAVYIHPNLSHIPVSGSSGNILQWSSAGTALWKANGTNVQFLRGDGTWAVPYTTGNGILLESTTLSVDPYTTAELPSDGTKGEIGSDTTGIYVKLGNDAKTAAPGNHMHQTYQYDQVVPSDTWIIQHNLGKLPSVTIVDSGNSVVIGEVHYDDINKITISFSGGFSGKAYLN